MKLSLALLVAPVAAFVAPSQQSVPTAMHLEVADAEIGVDPGPFGMTGGVPSGKFWDEQESFARRRAVEVKHGRIAMTAFIGMMVQELGITFPGSLTLDGSTPFSELGTGFEAVENIPAFGKFQIVAFIFLAETVAMPAGQYTGGPQNLPGGYDGSPGTIPGGYPFTNQIEDPASRTRALTCELQNGRGAMLGVTGAMMHSMLDSCDHHFFYPITHN